MNSSPSDVTAVTQRQPVIIKGFLLFVTLKQSGGRVWRSLAQEGTANQSLLHATQLDRRKGSRHRAKALALLPKDSGLSTSIPFPARTLKGSSRWDTQLSTPPCHLAALSQPWALSGLFLWSLLCARSQSRSGRLRIKGRKKPKQQEKTCQKRLEIFLLEDNNTPPRILTQSKQEKKSPTDARAGSRFRAVSWDDLTHPLLPLSAFFSSGFPIAVATSRLPSSEIKSLSRGFSLSAAGGKGHLVAPSWRVPISALNPAPSALPEAVPLFPLPGAFSLSTSI